MIDLTFTQKFQALLLLLLLLLFSIINLFKVNQLHIYSKSIMYR